VRRVPTSYDRLRSMRGKEIRGERGAKKGGGGFLRRRASEKRISKGRSELKGVGGRPYH